MVRFNTTVRHDRNVSVTKMSQQKMTKMFRAKKTGLGPSDCSLGRILQK